MPCNVTDAFAEICSSSKTNIVSFSLQLVYMSSGRLFQSLADATDDGGFFSLEQIIYNIVGFSITAGATAAITIYAKRTLQTLRVEDELS